MIYKTDKENKTNSSKKTDCENHKGYLTALILALIITCVSAIVSVDNYNVLDEKTMMILASDGAFYASAIMLLIGAVLTISKSGGFDSFTYSMRKITGKKSNTSSPSDDDYFTYVTKRREKLEDLRPKKFLVIGVVYLALSIMLAVIYNI